MTEKSLFAWKGIDTSKKSAKGEHSSESEISAKVELRAQGYRVTQIKKVGGSKNKGKKITSIDISIFARQLATMISAGVPLVQSFDIVGKGHENPSMRILLLDIKQDIESGETLAEALSKRPAYFDLLFCNLVEAGEKAGVLETLLDKIATYKEKTESMKKKIKKALTYPVATLAVAFIVTAILLIFVVPVFENLFKSFGADLPSFTKMVISMSEWMQKFWWVVIASLYGAMRLFRYQSNRSFKFRYFVDKTLLGTPVIGLILNKSAIARFARTLATMSAAGVPLVEALESVSGACGSMIYEEAILKMRDQISDGYQLQYAMGKAGIWPHMVQQMVAIGEESGSMDAMLSKVADFYDEEVDNLVDNLSSLMEPIIMVVLGVIVGGLIVSMYLPIFKMGDAIS